MDDSKEFQSMLNKAIESEPLSFKNFDRTKNVQDQLQEMVGGYGAGFIDWFHWRNTIYPQMQNPFGKEWRFDSYEQLWLAFVMKEKYNKVWDGEKWQTIK